jgi:hypothetical protein
MMRGEEFAGTPVASYSVEPRPGVPHTYDVVVVAAGVGDERVEVEPLKEELEGIAREAGTETVFHVKVRRAPARRVLLATDPVPAFGWRTYQPADEAVPARPVTCNDHALRNEHMAVEVDTEAGTFTLATHDGLRVEGLNRYVNGGDGGDTYNYSPPADDRVVDRPIGVSVEVVEPGPLRARVLVTSRYEWPTHAEGDERSCAKRSDTTVPVEVRTTLELRAGEPFVRVRTELDNPARDHRLRAHFPLPAPVTGSDAECAFAVVHRGLTAEGGPSEVGLPTFPSRRFVDCSDGQVGLALVHDGLLEYEVVEDGTEVALTLLRAVGYLSRLEPALRPNPAGPPLPVNGAQMPGRQAVEYAVVLHRGDWRRAHLYELADDVLVPLDRAPVAGVGGTRPQTGSLLDVAGAQVSACHRQPGGLVLRLFNPTPDPATARVRLAEDPASGWVVDLRGRSLHAFDGTVELAPAQVVTLVVPTA